MNHKHAHVFSVLMLVLICANAFAGESPDNKHNLGKDKLALKGYDPVTYFTQDRPGKGQEDITVTYKGDVFRFASEANREKFTQSPEQFAPAYGGWCAYALAKDGSEVDIDPNMYKIVNGRLMLFYKGWFGNALSLWNEKDEQQQVQQADEAWKKISGEDAPAKGTESNQ